MKHDKVMIITNALSIPARSVVQFFKDEYFLILLDSDTKTLKKMIENEKLNATYLKFDIRQTVDLVTLSSLIKKMSGFHVVINFPSSTKDDDVATIYKKDLIGTKNLLNYLYPLVHPSGVAINISPYTLFLTPISQNLFPLLNDPLQKKFLQDVLPLTSSTTEAISFSQFACGCVIKRDAEKWGLKKARIINLITNFTNDEQDLIENPFSLDNYYFTDEHVKLISAVISNDVSIPSGKTFILDKNNDISFLTHNK